MAFRQSESSFANFCVDKRLSKINSFLKEIDNVIDFKSLRPILAKNGIGVKNRCGNKAYDSLIMFKILLLQKFYSFSDEAAERSLLTDNQNDYFLKSIAVGLHPPAAHIYLPAGNKLGKSGKSLLFHPPPKAL